MSRSRASSVKDQTERCYSWEGEWAHWTFSDLGGSARRVRLWAAWAAELYSLPPPTIRIARLRGAVAEYLHLTQTITVTPSSMNAVTVLHECAHYVAHSCASGEDSHAHGPRYMGIYIHLLSSAGIAPKDALLHSARNRGLVVSKMVTPKVLCK